MVPGPGACGVRLNSHIALGLWWRMGQSRLFMPSVGKKSKQWGGRNAYRPLANTHPNHSSMISQKPRCHSLLCPGSFVGRQSQRKSRTLMSPDDWVWDPSAGTLRSSSCCSLTGIGSSLAGVICFGQARELGHRLARTFYPIKPFWSFPSEVMPSRLILPEALSRLVFCVYEILWKLV